MIRWYKFARWQPRGRMHHLQAAMKLGSVRGPCFFRAVAFVLDVPRAKLCIGTFRAGTPEEQLEGDHISKVPFIHAWCEVGDAVFAPSTYERCHNQLVAFDRDDYYRQNDAKDVVYMSRANLKRLSATYGLGKYILYLAPLKGGLRFADVILDELGVKHRTSADGGVLPGE